jgi:copper homeostasis protein
MLRPRSGGFCYSDQEFETMLADCERLQEADGFVFGMLTPDFMVDVPRCQQLVKAAGKKEKVFHRAFDLVDEPVSSLETLIDLGFTRVLTSGLAPSADDGFETLELLSAGANGRIEIMPGGGVRAANAQVMANLGCSSIHLGPQKEAQDVTGGRPYRVLDIEQVAGVVRELEGL